MNARQLKTLSNAEHVKYFPLAKMAKLSNYDFRKYIPEEVKANFTVEQIQAIDTSRTSIGYLSMQQRENLTAAQVGKLNYRSFKLLPQSQLKHVNLSTSQIARLSNYDIATHVPTPVIQAFNRDQVLAISDSVYPSVRVRLTDQQQAWRP
jgi:hypothetical protein